MHVVGTALLFFLDSSRGLGDCHGPLKVLKVKEWTAWSQRPAAIAITSSQSIAVANSW